MENERLELFKLDQIDRRVLFWLMDNMNVKSLKGWIEYISKDYRERGILIDATKFYNETQEQESNQ